MDTSMSASEGEAEQQVKAAKPRDPSVWVSAMVGNSRIHWAVHTDGAIGPLWDSAYLGELLLNSQYAHVQGLPRAGLTQTSIEILKEAGWQTDLRHVFVPPGDFIMADVVPTESALWRKKLPTTVQIPPCPNNRLLHDLHKYKTLGVDRALAVRGAGSEKGYPVMVIDCGTALTFTAADARAAVIGGAVFPGATTCLQSLHTACSALPEVGWYRTSKDLHLPEFYAIGTEDNIKGGVARGLADMICCRMERFWKDYPGSHIMFTGGDGNILRELVLQAHAENTPAGAKGSTEELNWSLFSHFATHLIAKGIAEWRATDGALPVPTPPVAPEEPEVQETKAKSSKKRAKAARSATKSSSSSSSTTEPKSTGKGKGKRVKDENARPAKIATRKDVEYFQHQDTPIEGKHGKLTNGVCIYKLFEDNKWYFGKLDKIYPPEPDDVDTTEWWYVLFEDGERVTLTEGEIREGMEAFEHWHSKQSSKHAGKGKSGKRKSEGGAKSESKKANTNGATTSSSTHTTTSTPGAAATAAAAVAAHNTANGDMHMHSHKKAKTES